MIVSVLLAAVLAGFALVRDIRQTLEDRERWARETDRLFRND